MPWRKNAHAICDESQYKLWYIGDDLSQIRAGEKVVQSDLNCGLKFTSQPELYAHICTKQLFNASCLGDTADTTVVDNYYR